MKRWTVPNPWARGLRPVRLMSNPRQVEEITDRAKRYRAQRRIEQPEKRCIYCGRQRGARLDVEHIDGIEAHDNPENLGYACRPCNTRKGVVFARRGKGQKTRQFNPRRQAKGAQSLGQYMKAVLTTQGYEQGMTLDAAVSMLKATPAWKRSEFAREIWDKRRERQGEIPF